jgi:6-phosphogluconolactonase (cycloisomerase 2 family)
MSTVYIGSYSTWGSPPGRGLDVAVADPVTGALTLTGTVPGVPDASFFAFSADRRFLYATNESADGAVTALDLVDPANPVVLNQVPTGAGPTHLSVHDRHLLTANYTDGTIAVHRLEPGGYAGPCTDVFQHKGAEPHAHQILTDPSGQWILAVDLGADAVFCYALSAGTLIPHHHCVLPTGSGPRHLAFHPRGQLAYILSELRPEITVASWSPTTGRLAPLDTLPVATPGNHPAELAITRDARFLYATIRGDDTIATLTLDDLILVSATPTGGTWPRHLTLSPDERHVYVANQRSNTITHLPRDPTTGAVGTPLTTTPVNNVAVTAFGR